MGQIPTGSCAASTVTIDDLNYVTSDTKDLREIKKHLDGFPDAEERSIIVVS